MNRDDIIRIAEQSDAHVFDTNIYNEEIWTFNFAELERFAALVAAAEREACALVCEAERERLFEWGHGLQVITADKLATAIRARGEK